MSQPLLNILDFDRPGLQQLVRSLGEPGYRADQIIQWVHQRQITDWHQMSNLSKVLRAKLATTFHFKLPEIIQDHLAQDGTRKWLLRLPDGNSIETVYIPSSKRGTLCISSQVGCALNCSFCSTGKQGFSRNLTLAEIISQLWLANQLLKHGDEKVTNVVMMGMGEPLLNFEPVVAAINLMMDDLAYGLSKYRVTVSTSGVVPAMYKLREATEAALAISLHAPNDELRNQLVPLNKKYPLTELISACQAYFKSKPKRVVTFEYVMLKGVNDQPQHARELTALLKKVPCKINLIPFNSFPFTQYCCSDSSTITQFQNLLKVAGFNATVRLTRGDDIIAACGQLRGAFKDRTSRHRRWLLQQEGACYNERNV